MKNFPIKAIIFDCDGTLIDSEGSHFFAWQKVVLNRNHFFSLDDHILCMGNANPTIAQKLANKMGTPSAEELLRECRDYYLEHAKNGQKPIQHTVDFARKLTNEKHRLGIKLAVASAGKKEEILHSLKRIGIEDIFDAIISGQDDLPKGENKPKPYIFLHTAKILGVEPSSCVVIEDSLPGVTASVRAGCFTVAIPTHSTKIMDLSAADLTLHSLEGFTVEKFFQVVQDTASKRVPTVIFLNGTSSAGKTSVVQHLQEQLTQPFVHVGIDHFLFMLPSRYIMYGTESHLGFCFERKEDKISITKGSYAHKMNAVKLKSIQNLLDQDFNVIIDEVLFSEDDFQAYLELLQNYRVYFIAIKPSLEVAEQREKARGNRVVGLAKGLYDQVYQNKTVDLEVDNSFSTPQETASSIVQYLQSNPSPQAFQQNCALRNTLEAYHYKLKC